MKGNFLHQFYKWINLKVEVVEDKKRTQFVVEGVHIFAIILSAVEENLNVAVATVAIPWNNVVHEWRLLQKQQGI